MYKKVILLICVAIGVPTSIHTSSTCDFGVNPRGKCREKPKTPCLRCQSSGKHKDIRQVKNEFIRLQRQAGIKTPPSHYPKNGDRTDRKDNKATWQDRLQIRSELNELFNQAPLDPNHVEQKIQELEHLEPRHWPFPEDYRKLLEVRMSKNQIERE